MSTPISVSAMATVATPAADVWQVMREFGDLSWTKGAVEEVIAEGDGVGMTRRVRTAGSDQWIVERLTLLDDDAKTFSYVIDGEGLPNVDDYQATGAVRATDDGTTITWQTTATSPEVHAESSTDLLEAMASGMVNLFAAEFSSTETN